MKMNDVISGLEQMRAAREAWGKGRTEFFAGYDLLFSRYIYEACANFMSAHDVANALGVSPRTVRERMRVLGLDPKGGKRALNAKASEAMVENAALMGIDPKDMDLTSPLAYLPMGSELRQKLQWQTLSRVKEFPETGSAEQLAEKLTDAGIERSDAVQWVNEVIASGRQIA